MATSSSEYWLNGRDNTSIWVQVGGAGNPYRLLDIQAGMTAPSGGRQGVDSAWGRSASGQSEYLLTRFTGNPERVTADVMARVDRANWLNGLLGDLDDRVKCGCVNRTIDVRAHQRCGDQRVLTDYIYSLELVDAASTSSSFDNPLSEVMTGDNIEEQQQESLSAGFSIRSLKLVHNDVSGTVSDVALNKTVHICDDEWWVVGNADSSPGYLNQPVPKFLYTIDGGLTWTAIDITPFFSGNATDVLKVGNYVVVFSPTNAPAYADITSLKNATFPSSVWAQATGFTGITGSNFPRAAFATNSNVVWAVGAGGRIWKSSDGGLSFTAQTSPTSANLTTVFFATDYLGWFAGASGTLVRYLNGAFSVISVTGLTATINAVRVPQGRANQVYLGTANGNIYRSDTADQTRVTFSTLSFPQAGNGQINDLQFAGWHGKNMFILQSAVDGTSRVLRDISGGAAGVAVEIIGDFQSPSNFGMNSIAPANVNEAMVVGAIHETYAFIGLVNG